jgi:hypothetical protein
MSTIIAILCLFVLMFANTLGNFWFTYGMWPRRWLAFFGFALGHIVIYSLMQAVAKESSK